MTSSTRNFYITLQWNPSIKATVEGKFGFYREVSFSQGLCSKGALGHYSVAYIEGVSLHQEWWLEGSTVYIHVPYRILENSLG